jgi:Cation transporter/ATPase, N-terminus
MQRRLVGHESLVPAQTVAGRAQSLSPSAEIGRRAKGPQRRFRRLLSDRSGRCHDGEVRSQHRDWVSPPMLDPEEAADRLLRDLRTDREGLSGSEAQRRLLQYRPNVLQRRAGPQWPKALVRQLTHPLALLLWLAAGLLVIVGSHVVATAVVLIIMLNAAFSFVQELQAERAAEALACGYELAALESAAPGCQE